MLDKRWGDKDVGCNISVDIDVDDTKLRSFIVRGVDDSFFKAV